MGLSFGHMIILLAIVLVIFGAGKLPQMMGDLAKGIKAFKNGMKEGEADQTVAQIDHKDQKTL